MTQTERRTFEKVLLLGCRVSNEVLLSKPHAHSSNMIPFHRLRYNSLDLLLPIVTYKDVVPNQRLGKGLEEDRHIHNNFSTFKEINNIHIYNLSDRTPRIYTAVSTACTFVCKCGSYCHRSQRWGSDLESTGSLIEGLVTFGPSVR